MGAEVDLVELPLLVSLIDAPQMEFLAQPLLPGLHANEKVLATWREEFDWMRAHHADGVLVLVLHPATIARGARLGVLERLIAHMKEQGAESPAWATRPPTGGSGTRRPSHDRRPLERSLRPMAAIGKR